MIDYRKSFTSGLKFIILLILLCIPLMGSLTACSLRNAKMAVAAPPPPPPAPKPEPTPPPPSPLPTVAEPPMLAVEPVIEIPVEKTKKIIPKDVSGENKPLSMEEYYSQIISNEINNLSQGQIMFNPPEEMKVGVEERIEVRIAKKVTKEIIEGLKGRGMPQVEEIKVGSFMKVLLQGSSFEIKPRSNDEQIVSQEEFTEWLWDVTPLKSGTNLLLLNVTVRIKLPDGKEEKKDLPVFERSIKVKVNPPFTIMQFINKYWQWIASTIIIPLVVWFYKKRAKT